MVESEGMPLVKGGCMISCANVTRSDVSDPILKQKFRYAVAIFGVKPVYGGVFLQPRHLFFGIDAGVAADFV